jgi:hypothetical protein
MAFYEKVIKVKADVAASLPSPLKVSGHNFLGTERQRGGTFCSSSSVGQRSSSAHTSSVSNRSNQPNICGK